MSKPRKLYRIRFQEKGDKEPIMVTVGSFGPSDHFGLVTLADFVFNDATKLVVLPEEDEAKKRYAKTERLHLPYHVLLSVEEYYDNPDNVKNLTVLKTD